MNTDLPLLPLLIFLLIGIFVYFKKNKSLNLSKQLKNVNLINDENKPKNYDTEPEILLERIKDDLFNKDLLKDILHLFANRYNKDNVFLHVKKEGNDEDMLDFEYGVYDSNNSDTFIISLRRQFSQIESEPSYLHYIQVELCYEVLKIDPSKELKDGRRVPSCNYKTTQEWLDEVKKDPAYIKVKDKTPKNIKISHSLV